MVGSGGKGREGKGEWDARPASRQVPGAHWEKTGLRKHNAHVAGYAVQSLHGHKSFL